MDLATGTLTEAAASLQKHAGAPRNAMNPCDVPESDKSSRDCKFSRRLRVTLAIDAIDEDHCHNRLDLFHRPRYRRVLYSLNGSQFL